MIQTVNLHDFRQAFHNMGRGDQFSYEALELIYDYLEECDPDMELDVIALCCDISEMTPLEVQQYYDLDAGEMTNAIDYLSEQTTILGETDTTILFFNF